MTWKEPVSTARGVPEGAPRRPFDGKGATGFAVLSLVLALLAGSVSPAGADTIAMVVGATVLSKSNCRFSTSAATLDFGVLDPANPLDVNASASIPFICHGSAPVATFAFSDDGGRYSSGPGRHRMRHATVSPPEYLPYSFALSPASGTVPKNVGRNLTVTGTVLGADFRVARAGVFSDAVVISILP